MKLLAALLAFAALALPSPARPQDPPIPADTEIVALPSGLKYSVLKAGDGVTKPGAGDKVKVHYTGWTTDGKVFDSSVTKGQPFEFELGRNKVIKGWDEGVALMSKGARHKLTIPPELGYGARAKGAIPANATLIFEVELLDVTAVPKFKAGDKAKQQKTESGLVWEPLVEGKGALAAPNDVLALKIAFWNSKGELMYCTETGNAGKPVAGPVEGFGQPIILEAAKLLKVGSRYRFEWTAGKCFGPKLQPGMDAAMEMVWELELVELKKPMPVPPFAMPDPAKLTKTASGLAYEVIKEGEGPKPKRSDTVTAHYAGWLTDGKLFDSSYSRAEPADFPLFQVIPGWTEGLQLMSPGAVYRFVIPANLGYGDRGFPPDIPPGATLVFQIELLKIGQ